MKIVIDVPEVVMETRQYVDYFGGVNPKLVDIIENGTPLPKGHGRLIDADDIDNHIIGHVDTRNCPTIIEADEGEVDE